MTAVADERPDNLPAERQVSDELPAAQIDLFLEAAMAAAGRIRPLSAHSYALTIGKSSHRVVYCGLRRPRVTAQSRLAFFKLDEPS